ncbi:hypothetical protein KR018_002059, partial [Drosophila ironensis]
KHPTSFSLLMVVLGCLALTSNAQDDYTMRANQMIEYFGNTNISLDDKVQHVGTLVHFYETYRDSISTTPEQRAQIEGYLQRYRQLESTQGYMVDGMPVQGGGGIFKWLGKMIIESVIGGIIGYGIEKATSQ